MGAIPDYRVTLVSAAGDAPAAGGDASAANQTTGNASLANIDTDLGAVADSAYASGSGSVISVLKGLFGKFVVGAGTAAAATRVTYASDGATVPVSAASLPLPSGAATLTAQTDLLNVLSDAYETVAASQTAQILGATGAVGDFLSGVLIVPGTTAAGAVSIIDGNGSSISVFAGGGTTALTTLIPFFVPIGAKCVNNTTPGWKVTTGANVTVVGTGNFT